MSEDFKSISWPGWDTVRLIGRGSFGAVYEIERKVFDETEKAALKVISIPQNSGDIDDMYSDGYDEESITSTFKSHLQSIVAEYSLMRKMNGSANIVNCDDVRYIQHDDGIGWDIFIKMELLTPLTKALSGNVDEETVIKIAKDMCGALELCKKHGIVHRDIKPQNIFVSEHGDYKLGDFGIAKTVEKTMGGTKIGTYKYMAPEVYNNQPYGSGADIYSLGLVLYWLLNERRMPFMPLPPEKLKAGVEESSRHRRLSGEKLPEPAHGSKRLKQIVLKACAYDPKERYQTATEMLQDIDNLFGMPVKPEPPEPELPIPLESKPEPVVHPTPPQPESKKKSKLPLILGIAVAIVIVIILLLFRSCDGGKADDDQPQGTTSSTTTEETGSQSSDINLTTIAIQTMPSKITYYVGDTLNAGELTLTATYNNGTTKTISSGFSCSPTTLSTAGTQTITVNYEGKQVTFTVNVLAVPVSSISMKTEPSKTSYFVGEDLDLSGLVLLVTYENGEREDITEGYERVFSGFQKAGEQEITVTYGGQSVSFVVNVMETVVNSIAVKSNPTETSYYVGDALNTSGLSLTATYNDGTTKTISSGFSCSPTTLSTAGTQTITVNFEGKKATFTVNVTAVSLSSITVKTQPSKTSYYVGDTLKTSGLALTATYNNGTTKTITSGFSCSPTTLSTAGTQTITVSYEGQKTTFSVSVTPVYVTGISLDKSSLSLIAGDNAALTVMVSPSNATNTAVSWMSSNTSVATVDSRGKVTAVAEGTATITVISNDGNKTATCSVIVSTKVHSLTFNANGGTVSETSRSVKEGASYGTLPTPTRTGYSFNGWYTAKSGGSKVSESTVMGSSNATVYAQWTQITIKITPSSTSCYVGSSLKLTATVSGSDATVTWSSNNTSVISVASTTGEIIWIHGEDVGSATITATVTGTGVSTSISYTIPKPIITLSSYSGSRTQKATSSTYRMGNDSTTWYYKIELPTVTESNVGGVVVTSWEGGNALHSGDAMYVKNPGTYTFTYTISAENGHEYTATYTYKLSLNKTTSATNAMYSNCPDVPNTNNKIASVPANITLNFTEIGYSNYGVWGKCTYNGQTGWVIISKYS